MEHDEAISLMASEKYILGELSPEMRDAFEEHFFDCVECANDVKAGIAFRQYSKLILAESQPAPVAQQQPRSAGWLKWLRPAVVVPVMAMLVAVVLFQNVVTFPGLKTELAQLQSPQVLPSVSLINVNTRGTDRTTVYARAGEGFLLFLDVPTTQSISSYSAEFIAPDGSLLWTLPISSEAAKDTVSIRVPAGLKISGQYTVVVKSAQAPGTEASEVGRYPFELKLQ